MATQIIAVGEERSGIFSQTVTKTGSEPFYVVFCSDFLEADGSTPLSQEKFADRLQEKAKKIQFLEGKALQEPRKILGGYYWNSSKNKIEHAFGAGPEKGGNKTYLFNANWKPTEPGNKSIDERKYGSGWTLFVDQEYTNYPHSGQKFEIVAEGGNDMNNGKNFELFVGDDICKAGLPVNPIMDDFAFYRFAPLAITQEMTQGDGDSSITFMKTTPFVVPRDAVNPEAMWKIRLDLQQLFPEMPDHFLRGGMTFRKFNQDGSFLEHPQWKGWLQPEIAVPPILDPGIVTSVQDFDVFLGDRKIVLPEGTFDVALTDDDIENLINQGYATIPVMVDNQEINFTFYTIQYQKTRSIFAFRPPQTLPSQPPIFPFTLKKAEESPPTLAIDERFVEKALTSFAPPKLEFVLYLPFRQQWELLGYSRGDLLNTISLGPEEETIIEITTWDRRKQTRDQQTTVEREGMREVAFSDKDSMEVVKETTKNNNWNFNVEAGVELPPVKVSAGFEIGEEVSTVDRSSRQTVSEAVRKASIRVKTTRQTKISETHEFGREEKVTRTIKNPNLCHTLNLSYFEILANYRVTEELLKDQIKLCVLVTNLVSDPIDREFVITWEGVLNDSAVLLSTLYEEGFNAAKTLAARDKMCELKCAPPCICDSAQNSAAVGGDPDTIQRTKDAVEQISQTLKGKIITLRDEASLNEICDLATDTGRWLRSVLPEFLGGMNNEEKQEYEKEWREAKPKYHMWLYRTIALELLQPRLWELALDYAPNDDISPEALEQFLATIKPNEIDALSIANLKSGGPAKLIEMVSQTLTSRCLNPVPLLTNFALNDAGFSSTLKQARTRLAEYKTALQPAPPATIQQGNGDEGEPGEAPGDEPEKFKDENIVEEQVKLEALLNHIRANESYYRQAIWNSLDRNDQLRILSINGERIPEFVEPKVIGFIGNQAVMPYLIDRDDFIKQWFQDNIIDNSDLGQDIGTEKITTLPTNAVFMESQLGQCDACEDYIIQLRALDLQQKAADVKAVEERAKQEEQETQRFKKRLQQDPPLLDDPKIDIDENALRILLKQEEG